MDSIKERVERGIGLLDKKGPRDWRKKIPLGRGFNICGRCVLHYVYGDYSIGMRTLGLYGLKLNDMHANAYYGFTANLERANGEYVVMTDYKVQLLADELTAEWTRQLLSISAASQPTPVQLLAKCIDMATKDFSIAK